MSFLILVSILSALTVALLVYGIKTGVALHKKLKYWEHSPSIAATIIGGFMFTVLFGITLGVLCGDYSDKINVPLRIEALATTISEQSALVSKGDVGIGNGLEGVEIKKVIQQAIRDKNDLIAYAKGHNKSSWTVFKIPGY